MTTLTFDALDNGRIVGTGTSRLHGDRVCTFPNAQVNAQEIEVSVGGTWDQRGFHLSLLIAGLILLTAAVVANRFIPGRAHADEIHAAAAREPVAVTAE